MYWGYCLDNCFLSTPDGTPSIPAAPGPDSIAAADNIVDPKIGGPSDSVGSDKNNQEQDVVEVLGKTVFLLLEGF